MAITVTQRGAVNTNADADPISIASVALTVDKVYIAVICTSAASGDAPSIDGISGTGLSMTRSVPSGGDGLYASRRIDLWYGKCTASGTVTVSAELSASSTQSDFAIYELDGVDTGGTNGVNAIVQTVCVDNGSTSVGGIDLSLAAFGSSDNRPFAFAHHRAQEATAHDSGGGYSELLDASHNSPSSGFCVQWHSSSADTTPSFTWTTSAQAGGIAVELKAVAGNVTVEVPVATLTLTTFAPTIAHSIVVPLAELATTTFAPSVVLGTVVTPPAAELTTTTFVPEVNLGITVPLAELTLTTFAPTVSTGAGPVEIVVPTANLVTESFAPQVNLAVTVPAAELVVTTFVPLVNLGVVVPTAELTTATFAPLIDLTVTVPVTTLTLTSFEPTVEVEQDIEVVVPAASLTLTSFAPTVTSSTPMAVVTQGPWLVGGVAGSVALEPGDEIFFVITGPSADAPKVRISVPLC